jgi:exopolyphosphatase/guanosine-5'-triphosphate,3'-diphosphate pyrophosphatase
MPEERKRLVPNPGESTVVAAFDIGSNSIKMTVAAVSANGGIEERFSATKTVRLGEGIDRTGQLAGDRIDAALEALKDMSARARAHGASQFTGVATEAVRVARNGAAFLDQVRRETGISTVAITGDAEASLAYTGLLADYHFTGQVVMADIGGASTEIVIGSGPNVLWSKSFPLGSGRLTDRFLESDPPTTGELNCCRQEAEAVLAGAPLGEYPGALLAITGGTGEYLGRLVRDISSIQPDEIAAALQLVTTLTANELAQRVDIPPMRARVLPAGIAVAAGIAGRLNPATIAGTRSGLRTGLLLQAAKESAR